MRGAELLGGSGGAEWAYLEALRRTAVSDLITLAIPAGIYFNHLSPRDILRLSDPYVA
jgi:hypothetical protein